MIRKRFKGARTFRLFGWTAVGIAWVSALFVRTAGTSSETGATPSPPPAPIVDRPTAVMPTVPALPAGGLTIIRYTPRPPPEPKVVTRVVEQTVVAPATPPASPSPAPRPASSGS